MPVLLAAATFSLPLHPLSAPQGLAAGSTPTATRVTTTPVGSTASTPGTPIPEQPTLPHHYVVLIVVDALKPDYLSLAPLPHIKALMQMGVTYDRAWVGEMESVTPDVHVTFGTGTLPSQNGFMGFGWAAPQTRQTVDFRTLLANRAIDPVLQALPQPAVAARLHQMMPKAVSVAASGHKDYAAVGLGGGAATYELYGKFDKKSFIPAFMHAPPPLSKGELQSLSVPAPLKLGQEDSWAVRYSLDVVQRVRPRLLMINLPEIDTWGHWYGPRNTAVFRQLILNVDRQIGLIEDTYRRLGLLDRTDFIITADHSMMESRAAYSWGSSLAAAASAAHTAVARADGEGGAVWLRDPAQARAVAERLVALKPSHVEAIFYRSAPGLTYSYALASPVRWLASHAAATALQHLVDTTAGRNGPDLWVLYRENYTVVPRNVQGVWKGTHGGATWKVQHIPLIMAGPDIRRGAVSHFPARAIDIAPTMERLLGLPAIHRDGLALADALLDPSRTELKAQQAVESGLNADVQALQAQSAADERQQPHWPTPPPVARCALGPRAPAKPGCATTSSMASNE